MGEAPVLGREDRGLMARAVGVLAAALCSLGFPLVAKEVGLQLLQGLAQGHVEC